jgi:hypothetical protein
MNNIRCPHCEYEQDVDTTDMDFDNADFDQIEIIVLCENCKKPIVIDISLTILLSAQKPSKLVAKADYKIPGFSCKKGDMFYTSSDKNGDFQLDTGWNNIQYTYENIYKIIDQEGNIICIPADPDIWEFQEASDD